LTRCKTEIGEDEAVALDDFSSLDRNGMREHRTVVGERVKLAALAARIDAGGQLGEERRVELTAGKSTVERAGIDARQARMQSAVYHLVRKRGGVEAEQREDR
jgi:hypothetical protein